MPPRLDCPHCGYKAMPAVTKALGGTLPWRTRTCRHCVSRVGIPVWGGLLASVPFAGFLALMPHVPLRDGAWLLAALPLAVAMHCAIMLYAVPLVSRDRAGRRRL